MPQHHTLSSRGHAIQKASYVGIVGNAFLALLKIVIGVVAKSAAVVADGIDSASDIIGSLITLYANRVAETPPDKGHPWGHSRIEALATKLLSVFILFAGVQLVVTTARTLIDGKVRPLPGKAALVVTIVSIFGKLAIALYKFRVAKVTESSMVRADAINMKNDIFLSSSVLVGLGVTYLSGLPMVDTIVGLLLGLWIIKTGAEMSLEGNAELMDGLEKGDTAYDDLFAAVDETAGVHNPHKARIRKLNTLYDIILDIELDGGLTISEAHRHIQSLEANIRKRIPKIFDIVIHVEPLGNVEEEQFGLSPDDLT